MGRQDEVIPLKRPADTFETRLREVGQAKDESFASAYFEGRSDAFGWAATYCRLMAERERTHA